LEGTYHEAESSIIGMHQHLVHFKADPTLKASLAKLQTGRSSTFYLTLGGELRETTMARDPSVVAAEAAAGMKVRVERALAKAIASSRPGLCPAGAAVAASDGSLVHPEQQQQHGNKITDNTNKLKPNLIIACIGRWRRKKNSWNRNSNTNNSNNSVWSNINMTNYKSFRRTANSWELQTRMPLHRVTNHYDTKNNKV
jgi:hypothetical protein